MAKKWTPESIREKRKPTVIKVDVLLDADIEAELVRLRDELLLARRQSTSLDEVPDAVRLVEEIEAVGKKAEAATVTFTFQGIGRRAWWDLVKQHPPTKDQSKGRTLRWNDDTFPPAALAASCIDPEGLDEKWWIETLDDWDEGQVTDIWRGCLEANLGEGGEGKAALRLASEVRASIETSSQPQSE